jgi:2-polyprenyl-3-methyl-5-hydroxy-6-metoxy-1,4-benzoquinol methylase
MTVAPNRDLDAIAQVYDPSRAGTSFDWHLKRLQAKAITPWLAGADLLELGCATGELASWLEPHAATYTVVEGAAENIRVAQQRLPGARFVHGRWESADPGRRFTDIICCNALEHLQDPHAVLERCRAWVREGGRLHVCVPNGTSLHRQAAARMGLISVPWELNDSDRAQGHWRNYTVDTLLADLSATGWSAAHVEGIGLKAAPGAMLADWPAELVDALDSVVKQYTPLAAEIYVAATPG